MEFKYEIVGDIRDHIRVVLSDIDGNQLFRKVYTIRDFCTPGNTAEMNSMAFLTALHADLDRAVEGVTGAEDYPEVITHMAMRKSDPMVRYWTRMRG